MSDVDTETQRPLKRSDLKGPQALTTLRDRGELSGEIAISNTRGGMRFENMLQMMEFAKMMSVSDIAVPQHLRANPGACLAVALQADEWGFSPFAVANKSYAVNDRLSYESQLVHAVIERRAPLEGRLRGEWIGEGPTRQCVVTGRLIGEAEPFVWTGPEIGKIKTKNSPEWTNNPDKQLWYHASRDWARIYCPDVLLGVYTRDELENSELGPDRLREDSSDVLKRLTGGGEGRFDAQGIATTLAGTPSEPQEREAVEEREPETPPTRARKGGKRAAAKAEPEVEPSTVEPENTVNEAEPETEGTILAEPSTPGDYTHWATRWIGNSTDPDYIEQRWESEKELRARCKVSVTERKRLEREVLLARTTELRGA
jgi:hypothetical protein